MAAIHHGADAVYIGGPRFGAREAVGNPVSDIEELASEAHLFGAKVYVTLNTILYNEELEPARKMIYELQQAGIDALIIQDMGLLEMDLPPIPLHASTQVHNYSVEKIQFLEKIGIKRAVLARELSLNQIHEIRSNTQIELEAFIHGSLCVSLSGQCYMSHSIGGRSANRGACAQPCRKIYSLVDSKGETLIANKHLLSLKDLNQSGSLQEMMDAGITSFKIEGRLKDVDYVKNITAYYRRKIDATLEGKPSYCSSSIGKSRFDFNPDPVKSFNRGFTNYFLKGRTPEITSFDSPKSFGEEVGKVRKVSNECFEIESKVALNNNDGLFFLSKNGESCGIKINQVTGKQIYPDKMNGIYQGAVVYRNFDHEFRKKIDSEKGIRKISIRITLKETERGIEISAEDEGQIKISEEFSIEKELAKDVTRSREYIVKQLSKSGETAFEVMKIETNGCENYFFPISFLNQMRRGILEKLSSLRKQKPHFTEKIQPNAVPFPQNELKYQTNVSNDSAIKFYQRHGVVNPEIAFEKQPKKDDFSLMTTKHCLKYQLGYCRKYNGTQPAALNEPLYLVNETGKYRLEFDCQSCHMNVLMC